MGNKKRNVLKSHNVNFNKFVFCRCLCLFSLQTNGLSRHWTNRSSGRGNSAFQLGWGPEAGGHRSKCVSWGFLSGPPPPLFTCNCLFGTGIWPAIFPLCTKDRSQSYLFTLFNFLRARPTSKNWVNSAYVRCLFLSLPKCSWTNSESQLNGICWWIVVCPKTCLTSSEKRKERFIKTKNISSSL